MDEAQGYESKIDAQGAQIGVMGDNTHIEGGIHFHGEIPPLPWQLPPRAEHFVGRETELAQILTNLQPGRVVTLTGPGGIGKTALASEALYRLATNNDLERLFPDGVIFHNFYNDPQATLALEHIARSYGIDVHPSPAAAARRALAGKRALLVLDGTENADDLDVILAVLGRCGVLLTSRQRHDAQAQWLAIAPLHSDEAVALLQHWGGTRAIDEIIAGQICEIVGYLPLAVRLIGRYLTHQEEDATDYLTWLRETPLVALDQGQRQSDSIPLLLERHLVRMSEVARQVMVCIGLLALAPFTVESVVAALNLPIREVRTKLGELVNHGFLLRTNGQYVVSHALIHTYAQQSLIPDVNAIQRLATYYDALAREHNDKGLEGYQRLDNEREHILCVLRACNEQEKWEAAHALAWAVSGHGRYLDVQGHTLERKEAIEIGLTAAQALGRCRDERGFLGNLGTVYHDLGKFEQAIDYYHQSLFISREVGDRQGEASDLGNLGTVYFDLGQIEKAIECHQLALAICRETGDYASAGARLANMGVAYRKLRKLDLAVECLLQALSLTRQLGLRRDEGSHMSNLGLIYGDLGHVEQAVELFQQALTISREIGDRFSEGIALGNLGSAYRSLGQTRQAVEHLEQSLAIFEKFGSPKAEQVRQWLVEI